MAELDDKLATLQADIDAYKAEVATDVGNILATQTSQAEQIASLQSQLANGTPVTQAQLDTITAMSTDLVNSTAALHARVSPPEPSSSSSGA